MWPLRNPPSSLLFLFINSTLSLFFQLIDLRNVIAFPIALLSDHRALFNFWIKFLLLCIKFLLLCFCFCFSFFDLRSINPRNGNCFGLLGFLSSRRCLGVCSIEFLSSLFFHLVVLSTVWMLGMWRRNPRNLFCWVQEIDKMSVRWSC